MEKWNPMEEDFGSISFNSYDRGPGAMLPLTHLPSHKMRTNQVKGKSSTTLYVSRIPLSFEEEGLRNIFSKYGNVLRVHRGNPRPNLLRCDTEPLCFGFVTYSSLQEAENAIRELHDKPPFRLRIQFALSPEEKAEKDLRKQLENKHYQDLQIKNSTFRDENIPENTNSIPSNGHFKSSLLGVPEMYRQQQENCVQLQGAQIANLKVTAGTSGRTVSCKTGNKCLPSDSRAVSHNTVYEYRHGSHCPQVYQIVHPCGHHCGHNSNIDNMQVVRFLGTGNKVARYVQQRVDNRTVDFCTAKQDLCQCNQSGLHCISSCNFEYPQNFEERQTVEHTQFYINRCDPGYKHCCRNNKQDAETQVELNDDTRLVSVSTSVQTNSDEILNIKETNSGGLGRGHKKSGSSRDNNHEFKTKKADVGSVPSLGQNFQNSNVRSESKSNNNGYRKSLTFKNEQSTRKQQNKKTSPAERKVPTSDDKADQVTSGANKEKMKLPDSNHVPETKSSVNKAEKNNKEKNKRGCLKEKPDMNDEHCQIKPNVPDGLQDAVPDSDVNQGHNVKQSNALAERFVEVAIPYWQNPNEIWLHNVNKLHILQQVTQELQMLGSGLPSLQSYDVGDMCAAIYHVDGLWYRARVNKVNSDGTAEVAYIDYGNCETVTSSQMTSLPAYLQSIPPQAIPCQMAGIKPSKKASSWSPETIELCTNLITNTSLKAHKVGIGINNMVDVDLINKEGNSIPELLVTLGHADWIDDILPEHPLGVGKGDLVSTESLSLPQIVHNETTSASPLSFPQEICLESVSATSPTFLQEIQQNTDLDSQSSLLQEASSSSTLTSSPSLPSETHLESTSIQPTSPNPKHHEPKFTFTPPVPSAISLLSVGQNVKLSIAVKNDDSVWALVDVDLITAVTEIEQSIAVECSENQNKKYSPSVGEVVAAFSPNYCCWYRGCVLRLEENGCFVRYIDYGNEEKVSNVQPLINSHISVFSPALYCTSSDQMPLSNLFVGAHLEGTVKSVDKESALLEIVSPNQTSIWQLTVQPWNHGLIFLDLAATSNVELRTDSTVSFQTTLPEKEESDKRIMHSTMKKIEFTPGDCFNVIITWQELVYKLYIQKSSVSSDMVTMMQDLNAWCEKFSEICYIPVKNEMVCAKYSTDNIWYRARVCETSDSNSCIVHFVDYGNTQQVTFDNVRPLSDEASLYPLFGICVVLDKESDIELIPDFQYLSTTIWLLEVNIENQNHPFRVKLKDQNGTILSALLTEMEILSEELNSPVENESAMAVATQETNTIEENSTENCEKFMIDDLTFVDLPVGEAVKVVVINIISLSAVFCSLYNEEVAKSLSKMSEEVDLFCSALPEGNYRFNEGEICLAKFEDGHWYRAMTIDEEPVQTFMAVDLGKMQSVNSSDLRRIVSRFTSLPMQVVTCCFDESFTSGLSVEAVEKLIATVLSLYPVEIHVLDKTETGEYVIDIPIATNEFKEE